jgi:hypothetical protein
MKKHQKMSPAQKALLSTSLRLAWARRKRKPTPEQQTSHFLDHRSLVERALDRMSAHHDHELIDGTYSALADGGRPTFRGARHGLRLSSFQESI